MKFTPNKLTLGHGENRVQAWFQSWDANMLNHVEMLIKNAIKSCYLCCMIIKVENMIEHEG
jgi:hypothetical protein